MKTLIIVDVQNDFVPGGALGVSGGREIVPIINGLMPKFELIVATQDWHPANHESFAANHPEKKPGDMVRIHGLDQILWPVHCVQNTKGAEFLDTLQAERIQKIIRKGTDPGIDSYSGFFDNGHLKSTGLGDLLQSKGATELYVTGIATDYCVKFTVLDALQLGFTTFLVEDACRGVNLKPSDVRDAVETMRSAGAKIINSNQLQA